MAADGERPVDEFVRLYATVQMEIYRFIRALVPTETDARDVLQETALALWAKFDQYDSAEPFLPWARSFARFEVLSFYKSRNRQATLSTEAVEALAAEYPKVESELQHRRDALQHCLGKLEPSDRDLVQQHYEQRITIQQLAEDLGFKANTLYKQFARIRRALLACVNRTLAWEAN